MSPAQSSSCCCAHEITHGLGAIETTRLNVQLQYFNWISRCSLSSSNCGQGSLAEPPKASTRTSYKHKLCWLLDEATLTKRVEEQNLHPILPDEEVVVVEGAL